MTVLSLLSRKSPSTLRQLGGAFIQDYCGRFGHFGRTVLAYIEYKALWQCLVWTMIFGFGLAKGCCGGASLSCKGSSCYASLLGIGPRTNRSSCESVLVQIVLRANRSSYKSFFVQTIEQGKWRSRGLWGRFACSMPPFRPHRAGEMPFYATAGLICLLDVCTREML